MIEHSHHPPFPNRVEAVKYYQRAYERQVKIVMMEVEKAKQIKATLDYNRQMLSKGL